MAKREIESSEASFPAPEAMQPNLLSVPVSANRSFDLRHEVVPYFTNPWHFHPEIELNFVVSGSGTRFIGEHTGRFQSGEIILLGGNLPHYWKSDGEYYEAGSGRSSEAIVVRFLDTFAGTDFLWLPEMAAVRSLLERARDGLRLLEPLRTSVAIAMKELTAAEDFGQLLSLLAILHEIAGSDAVEVLSPDYVSGNRPGGNDKRLNRVTAYLLENFTRPVALKDVAELASMNGAAFCRYFKSQTGKTLTQYITGLRMALAGHLLSSTDESVTQICYQVGFENVSHFIQTFRKSRGLTPFEFRKSLKTRAPEPYPGG